MSQSKNTLDEVFESFGPLSMNDEDPEQMTCITLWVPVSYKKRYAKLQQASHQKFSKVVREVFIKMVDKADAASI
jgi:hypothetical protein